VSSVASAFMYHINIVLNQVIPNKDYSNSTHWPPWPLQGGCECQHGHCRREHNLEALKIKLKSSPPPCKNKKKKKSELTEHSQN